MKLLNKIILSLFLVLIFFGSIGVSVFEHFCSINGNEISYFAPLEDKCEKESIKQSCCSHKQNDISTVLKKEKCCSEQFSYIKLNTENHTEIVKLKNDIKFNKAFSYFSELFPIIYSKEEFIAFVGGDPPSKSGRQIIISNQVFRI